MGFWRSQILVTLNLILAFTVVSLDRTPNIFIFVAKDLGYNDVGWNNPQVKTPNLNELLKEGIELNQHYVLPESISNQAALLSGIHPLLHSETYFPTDLNKSFILLPQMLKSRGYTTHMFGKWELGSCKKEFLPTNWGFDSFNGYFEAKDKPEKNNYEFIADKVNAVINTYNVQDIASINDLGDCIEYNVDFAGNDIVNGAIENVETFQECQAQCSLRPDCNFWTWNPASFASKR